MSKASPAKGPAKGKAVGKGKGKGAAPPKQNPGACPKCGEDAEGQKFCPSCGEIQKDVANMLLSPRAAQQAATGVAAKLDAVALRKRFEAECAKDMDDQSSLFLKSFIFSLGDDWKKVPELLKDFRKMLRDEGESEHDANEIQAANFLQKHAKERTAIQRREEVRDMDLLDNQRICFLEYLLLHFKAMILTDFYKRYGTEPEHDLSNDGVGITGVGTLLLDELFYIPEGGLPAELVRAIDEFTALQRARNNRLRELEGASKGSGVKALAARNEIEQMAAADLTDMNRMEITLAAARRKAQKTDTASAALAQKLRESEAAEEAKKQKSRTSLKAKASLWEGKE